MGFEVNPSFPKVSVGILTRNAGKLFHKVMDSLIAQQTPWPFEVVILDSASKDATDAYAAGRGAKVVPYKPAKFKFGAARDTLFENCRGDVIVTISQDVEPADPHWLANLVAPVIDNTADAAIGEQITPPNGYSFYWDYHASWMRSIPIAFDESFGRIAISCANLAIKREVWEKLRFGDCETIEDRVLQIKLFQAGHRMVQIKQALSYHGHSYSWKELSGRLGSFAGGFARLGFPYTFRRLLRDLLQPSRYLTTANAFIHRKLVSWMELVYPFAMCFIQYRDGRKR